MKNCPYCAEEIQDAAVVCRFCQRHLTPQAAAAPPAPSPGVAAVLSFFFPGIGQVYKGQIGKGLGLLVLTILGYFMFIVPGLLIHIFVVVDAYGGQSAAIGAATPEAIAAREIYNRKTPEQRRAETRKTVLTLGGVIAVLFLLGVVAIWLSPEPGRNHQTPAEAQETAAFVERRIVYNAILLGGKPIDIAKRYKKTVEEIEIIQAEGKSRGWVLEDANKVTR